VRQEDSREGSTPKSHQRAVAVMKALQSFAD
jgi:hypothetical protein